MIKAVWLAALMACSALSQEFKAQIGGNYSLNISHLGATAPSILDYDSGAEDTVSLTHAGSEFFWGITNTSGSKAFIDFNLEGEAEYALTGMMEASLPSLAHRFYIGTKTNVARRYLDVSTNGALTTRLTATAGLSSLTNSGVAPTSISFPASGQEWTNAMPFNIVLYVNNACCPTATVLKNGSTIFSGITSTVTLMLKHGDRFSEVYTAGSPVAYFEPQ